MVGPLLIGALSQLLGLTAGFVTCGVLGLLSLVLMFTMHKRRATDSTAGRSSGISS
jgi:hypothetical protein